MRRNADGSRRHPRPKRMFWIEQPPTLADVQQRCVGMLFAMERELTRDMRLTLVARHPDDPDAHFVVTKDADLAKVAALLVEHATPSSETPPGNRGEG